FCFPPSRRCNCRVRRRYALFLFQYLYVGVLYGRCVLCYGKFICYFNKETASPCTLRLGALIFYSKHLLLYKKAVFVKFAVWGNYFYSTIERGGNDWIILKQIRRLIVY